MEPSWYQQLLPFFADPIWEQLQNFLEKEYQDYDIFPKKELLFRAFSLTPFDEVKVVILGQDPYHGWGQANGLAFSVNQGVKLPPSLRNIYQELASDLQVPLPVNGDLSPWARQGVLLLNTVLSVRQGQAHSHANQGWENLSTLAIQKLSERTRPIIFILWGNHAQSMAPFIDSSRHAIIKGPHPSPLSAYRGFFGSRPFSKANQLLMQHGETPINWLSI